MLLIVQFVAMFNDYTESFKSLKTRKVSTETNVKSSVRKTFEWKNNLKV